VKPNSKQVRAKCLDSAWQFKVSGNLVGRKQYSYND